MCVLQQESEFSNYLLLATEALIVQQRAAPPLGRAGCCLEGSRSPLKSVKMEIKKEKEKVLPCESIGHQPF